MGGLRKYMPLTHWTFLGATAAIIGLPGTSGFFSKDEILFKAFINRSEYHPALKGTLERLHAFQPPTWLGPVLYGVGVAAATMTAFYMCRLYFRTFWGEFNGWKVGTPSEVAAQEHGEHGHRDHGNDHLQIVAGPAPKESPWPMTVPLVILAAFSVFAGFLNPGFHIFALPPMEHWLEPVFKDVMESGTIAVREGGEHLEFPLAAGGVGAFLVGTSVAYWMYIAQKRKPADAIAAAFPRLHRLMLEKWRIDELYEATVLAAVDSLAETAAAFDQWIVDGILAKVSSAVVVALGAALRMLQNGVVHVYAAMMVVGLTSIGWFFVVPHPEAVVTETAGDYVIVAGPGMGYGYRWDADGNGRPDTETFSDQATVRVHLDLGKSQVVRLEVKNAFGFTAGREISLSRPKPEPTLELGSLGGQIAPMGRQNGGQN